MMSLWKCLLFVALFCVTQGAIEIVTDYQIDTRCGDNNLADGLNLIITCTYTLTDGDTLDTLQFRDADAVNVFGSVGGNVAGGSLQNGWLSEVTVAVSDTTITVNITSYDETSHTANIQCLGDTFDGDNADDWVDLPTVYDVPPDVPINSTTCTGGETLSGVNEVSFDATSSIDTGVYPDPTIVCLLDNNVVQTCTSDTTCSVTIASSGTVECYACLFNEQSASRTTCEVAIKPAEVCVGLCIPCLAKVWIILVVVYAMLVIVCLIIYKRCCNDPSSSTVFCMLVGFTVFIAYAVKKMSQRTYSPTATSDTEDR